MKLDEILEEIAKDSEIDQNKIDKEALAIASLQAKYYKIFAAEMLAYKAASLEYETVLKDRAEYYLGKADDEVYSKSPLDKKVLKSDLDMYLYSDDQVQNAKWKMDSLKVKVDTLESFIKSLTNRGFNLKTAVEYQKFKAGVY